MLDLDTHGLSIGLIRPQIPQNVGNIARTCVASGTPLHLARPMGFVLDDRRIKRSGLDYWPRLQLTVHDDEAALLQAVPAGCVWLFDSSGDVPLFEAGFRRGDWLIFGSETHGLPRETMRAYTGRVVRIPQVPDERCLNLATSVGIALYQAIGQAEKAD